MPYHPVRPRHRPTREGVRGGLGHHGAGTWRCGDAGREWGRATREAAGRQLSSGEVATEHRSGGWQRTVAAHNAVAGWPLSSGTLVGWWQDSGWEWRLVTAVRP